MRASEQLPQPVLLALAGRRIGQRPGRPKALFMRSTPYTESPKPPSLRTRTSTAFMDANTPLVGLVDQELRARFALDKRVLAVQPGGT